MVDIELLGKVPTLQDAITSPQIPAFPFFAVKLKKSKAVKKATLELEIDPTLYDWLINYNGGRDQIEFYISLAGEPVKPWSPDMGHAFDIMSELKIMSKYEIWSRIARESISGVIRKNANMKSKKDSNALAICEEILKSCQLLESPERYNKLMIIVKDAINSKTRDADTLIYRFAMLVFHYAMNNPPIISGVENWEEAYLNFIQDEVIQKKYQIIKNKLDKENVQNKLSVFKTVLSFIIGAYLYYRGVNEIGKK